MGLKSIKFITLTGCMLKVATCVQVFAEVGMVFTFYPYSDLALQIKFLQNTSSDLFFLMNIILIRPYIMSYTILLGFSFKFCFCLNNFIAEY